MTTGRIGISLTDSLNAGFGDELEKRLRQLKIVATEVQQEFRKLPGAVQQVGTAAKQVAEGTTSAATGTKKLADATGQATKQTKAWNAEQNNLARVLKEISAQEKEAARIKKELSQAQAQATKTLGAMSLAASIAGGRFGGLVSQVLLVKTAFAGLGQSGGQAVIGVTAVVAGLNAASAAASLAISSITSLFKNVSQVYGAFQQEIVNASAVMTGSLENVARLSQTAQKTAIDFRASSTEIAQGFTILGQSGFSLSESIGSIRSIAELSQATLADMKSATDLTTTAIRAYKDQNVDASQAANVFVAGITKSKLTVEGLRTAFNFVAVSAAESNVTLEETVGLLGTMADRGIKASTQATGLRGVLGTLLAPTAAFKEELFKVGLSLADVDVRSLGIVEVLTRLRDAGFDVANAYGSLDKRIAAAATTLVQNADKVQELTAAVTGTADATVIAGLQMDTWQGKMKIVGNLVENLGIRIGELTDGPMRDFLDAIIEFLSDTEGLASGLSVVMNSILQLGTLMVEGLNEVQRLFKGLPSVLDETGNAFSDVQTGLEAFFALLSEITAVGLRFSKWLTTTPDGLDKFIFALQQIPIIGDAAVSTLNLLVNQLSKTDQALPKVRAELLAQSEAMEILIDRVEAANRLFKDEDTTVQQRVRSYRDVLKAVLENETALEALTEEQVQALASAENMDEAMQDLKKTLDEVASSLDLSKLGTEIGTAESAVGKLTKSFDRVLENVEDLNTKFAGNQDSDAYRQRLEELRETFTRLEPVQRRAINTTAEGLVALSQSREHAAEYYDSLARLEEQLLTGTAAEQAFANATLRAAKELDTTGRITKDLGATNNALVLGIYEMIAGELSLSTTTEGLRSKYEALSGTVELFSERLDPVASKVTSISTNLDALSKELGGAADTSERFLAALSAFGDTAPAAFLDLQANISNLNLSSEELRGRIDDVAVAYAQGLITSEEYYGRTAALAQELSRIEGETRVEALDVLSGLYEEKLREVEIATKKEIEFHRETAKALKDLYAEAGNISEDEFKVRFDVLNTAAAGSIQRLKELVEATKALTEAEAEAAEEAQKYWEDRAKLLNQVGDSLDSLADKAEDLADRLTDRLNKALGETADKSKQWQRDLLDAQKAALEASSAQDDLRKSAEELIKRYEAGDITVEDFKRGLEDLNSKYDDAAKKTSEAADAALDLKKSLDKDDVEGKSQAWRQYTQSLQNAKTSANGLRDTAELLRDAQQKVAEQTKEAEEKQESYTERLKELSTSSKDTAAALKETHLAVSELEKKLQTSNLDSSKLENLQAQAGGVANELEKAADKSNIEVKVSGVEESSAKVRNFVEEIPPSKAIEIILDTAKAEAQADALLERLQRLQDLTSDAFSGASSGSGPKGFRWGGPVGRIGRGYGGGDKFPILTEAGEFVIRKEVARAIGYGRLNRLNRHGQGSEGKYNRGGVVKNLKDLELLRLLESINSSDITFNSSAYESAYRNHANTGIPQARQVASVAASKERSIENYDAKKLGLLYKVLNEATIRHSRTVNAGSEFSDMIRATGGRYVDELTGSQYESLLGKLDGFTPRVRERTQKPAFDAGGSSSSGSGGTRRSFGRGFGAIKSNSVRSDLESKDVLDSPAERKRKFDLDSILKDVQGRFAAQQRNFVASGLIDHWRSEFISEIGSGGLDGVIAQAPRLGKAAEEERKLAQNSLYTQGLTEGGYSQKLSGLIGAVTSYLQSVSQTVRQQFGTTIPAPAFTVDNVANMGARVQRYFDDLKRLVESKAQGFQHGGLIPEANLPSGETLIRAEAGEVVLNKRTVKRLGLNRPGVGRWLNSIASMADIRNLPVFHTGGIVGEGAFPSSGFNGTAPVTDLGTSGTPIHVTITTMDPGPAQAYARDIIIPEIERQNRRSRG